MANLYGDFRATVKSGLKVIPTVWTIGVVPSTGQLHSEALFKLSPRAEKMIRMMPSYYYLGNNTRRLMEIMASEEDLIERDILDLRAQFFVATATWGLRYWEQIYALPIQDGNTDYVTRRNLILAAMRKCDSEKCFVEGLELISGGPVIVLLLDPATNPYQIDIEMRGLLYELGPMSSPTAQAIGAGNLNGDYTYKVTFEYPKVVIPSMINVAPFVRGETSSGVTPNKINEIQQLLGSGTVSGGDFTLTYDNVHDPYHHNITTGVPNPPTVYETFQIAFNSDAAAIEAAMEGMLSLNPGEVTVTHVTGGTTPQGGNATFDVAIQGTTQFIDIEEMVVAANTLGTPLTISTLQNQTPSQPEIQRFSFGAGTPASGAATVRFGLPSPTENPGVPNISNNPNTTSPIPWNASKAQIKDALENLPNIVPGTLEVTGGPLPLFPVNIEFRGYESGFPQILLEVDGTNLTGGGTISATRVRRGDTFFGDSESNTVTATNQAVELSNIPRSLTGAIRRHIYRKKNAAPYDKYVWVGSIDDDVTTVFIDNIADSVLSGYLVFKTYSPTSSPYTYKIKFDDTLSTVTLDENSTYADLVLALESISSPRFPTIDVTAIDPLVPLDFDNDTAVSSIRFDGGDVAGKYLGNPVNTVEQNIVDLVGYPGVTSRTLTNPALEIEVLTGDVEVYPTELSETVTGITTYNTFYDAQLLTERNTAFNYTFQKIVDYIYNRKPAHLHVNSLRSAQFRASINRAGDPV